MADLSKITCCVVGTGFLGTRIIGELSRLGVKMRGYDHNATVRLNFRKQIEVETAELNKRQLCQPDQKFHFELMDNLEEACRGADFIFEAIYDDLEVKKELYHKITNVCKSFAVVCSNTLNLDLDDISEDALFKERIMGCRFFAPVYCIPLVEMNVSSFTSIETKEKTERFFSSLGYKFVYKQLHLGPRMITTEDILSYWKLARKKLKREEPTSGIIAQESSDKTSILFSVLVLPAITTGVTQHQYTKPSQIPVEHTETSCRQPVEHLETSYSHFAGNHAEKRTIAPRGDENLATYVVDHNERSKAGHVSMVHGMRQEEGAGGDGNLASYVDDHNELSKAGHVSMVHDMRQEEGIKKCVVCEERDIDAVLLPCSHMWLCYHCASALKSANKLCPACREEIKSILVVYKP